MNCRNKVSLAAIATLMIGTSSSALAQSYDLVINNGRVMDPETMYDDIANVGVKDGRIVAITKDKITGKETIDAKDLVVAPGFIDTHFHAIDPFGTKLGVADGITTGMDLESGAMPVGEWYTRREKAGSQVNYGATVGMGAARMKVHDPEVKFDVPFDATIQFGLADKAAADGVPGWSLTRSNVDQMNQIMKMLDEGLREGALGIGVPAAYVARGMTSYEQFQAQITAARYGRLVAVHTRYHMSAQTPMEGPISVSEILANAMVLRAPLLVAHDNDYGWWENEEKLQFARAQGFNVWSEYYPFTAGATLVSADFLRPDQWEKVNGFKYEETIYDPMSDKFLTKDEYLKAVKERPGMTVIVHMPPRKAWMKYWLTIPEMVVASDATVGLGIDGKLLPWEADPKQYAGHPRTSSSYSTTLQLARENGVPLMFTLSQLSYWTAKHLGDMGLEAMKQRGRVQVGKVADLTLFNPKTVKANATYKAGENGLQPTGIPYVIVNGTLVVKNGTVLPVKPGQPIRFPVEAKGRYEPVTVNKWLSEFSINVPDMHEVDDTGAGQLVKKK